MDNPACSTASATDTVFCVIPLAAVLRKGGADWYDVMAVVGNANGAALVVSVVNEVVDVRTADTIEDGVDTTAAGVA